MSKRPLKPQRPWIYPVIHTETYEQAKRNAETAVFAGADGVFLINHSIEPLELLWIASRVRNHFHAHYAIGVNFLGYNEIEAIKAAWTLGHGVMLWTDTWSSAAHDLRLEWEEYTGWTDRNYFGGVAFKYQAPAADLVKAVEAAAPYVSIITTSGDATGTPPTVEKIRTMHKAASTAGRPLAIASGITPENVRDYLGLVEYILVATGVSKSDTELDGDRIKALIKNATP